MIRPFILLLGFSLLQACSTTSYPWPEARTVSPATAKTSTDLSSLTRAQIMEMVTGRYAHYDVVAYEDQDDPHALLTELMTLSGLQPSFDKDGTLLSLNVPQ